MTEKPKACTINVCQQQKREPQIIWREAGARPGGIMHDISWLAVGKTGYPVQPTLDLV